MEEGTHTHMLTMYGCRLYVEVYFKGSATHRNLDNTCGSQMINDTTNMRLHPESEVLLQKR